MNRTLIITLLAIAVLGIGGATVYFLFFNTSKTATPDNGTTTLPVAGNTGGATTGGGGKTITSGGAGQSGSSTNTGPVTAVNRLIKINAGPVVPGEVVIDQKPAIVSVKFGTSKSKTATTTPPVPTVVPDVEVRYIERESGNVFSYLEHAATNTRINNKTLPGIQSALWLPDGSSALVRYLSGADFSTVNTYALAATSSAGFFLPQNLADLAVTAKNILMLASSGNGSSGATARLDGTHTTQVFTTPLSSLRLSFAGPSQYLAVTKASASLLGDAYLISPTGRFSTIAGPLYGLTAVASPDGTNVLVSWNVNGALKTELVTVATGAVTALPVATLADKCAWAADSSAVYCGVPMNPPANYAYPDDWYQGAVNFSDRIWKINVASRYAQLVLDFSSAKSGTLDATALAVDPNNTTLVFVNKSDGSLWSYAL